jgi:tetratricopeptide (TPR) repeat protein
MAAGAKAEKVTMTKWRPDWEAALGEYERAGTCFKGLKDYANAAVAFSKAAHAMYKCEILSGAGKHYETAGQMYKEANALSTAADMYERSAACYFEDGAIERGAEALIKGAKAVEPDDLPRASDFFARAVRAWQEDETRPVEFSVETFKSAVTFFLRTRQLSKAVDTLEEQLATHEILKQPTSAAKCVLSVVVAQLHADNYLGAYRWLADFEVDPSHAEICAQEEAFIAQELLDAFAAQSDEALALTVKKRPFHYLDSQALKLARELTLQVAEVPVEHVHRGPGPAAPIMAMESLATALPPLPPPPPPPPGLEESGADGAGATLGPATAAPAPAGTGPVLIRHTQPPALGDFGEEVDEFTDDLT